MRWRGWLQGAVMCQTVVKRWCDMTAIITMLKGGKRKKDEQDDSIPCVMEEAGVSPEKRKAWARLIQKIYEVD
jgi:hypothetical protein